MYFHVYSFKLQIHAHIYRSFIRHHKMLGVRIAKRKNEPQKPANPCGTKLRARIFFGAGKFASQTYPAGELKSRGNPAKVSPANIPFLVDNRKCCIFFVNAKQISIIRTYSSWKRRSDYVFLGEKCKRKPVSCRYRFFFVITVGMVVWGYITANMHSMGKPASRKVCKKGFCENQS